MDPTHNKGVTIVQQPPTMDFFLHREVAAASAMTYDELAQVLETKNPNTRKLYPLNSLNVIKMQNVGAGVLEDNIFSSSHVPEERRPPRRRAALHRRLAARLDLLP